MRVGATLKYDYGAKTSEHKYSSERLAYRLIRLVFKVEYLLKLVVSVSWAMLC